MRHTNFFLKSITSKFVLLFSVIFLSLIQLETAAQNFSPVESPEQLRKIETTPDAKKHLDDWGLLAFHYNMEKKFDKTQDLISRWEKLYGNDRIHRLRIEGARGLMLTLQEKPGEARDRLARAIQAFGPATNAQERHILSGALLTLGGALKDPILRDYDNANKVYMHVLKMSIDYDEKELALNGLRAGYSAGLMFIEMRPPQYATAIQIYDELIRNFRFVTEREARSVIAWSQINKGFALFRSNPQNPTLALIAYDQLIRDFGDDKNPEIEEALALAIYNAGVMTAAANPPLLDHALKFFEIVINKYSKNKTERIQVFVANSMYFKANIYDKDIKAYGEAKRLYTNFINTYGKSKHPDVIKHLNQAREYLKALP